MFEVKIVEIDGQKLFSYRNGDCTTLFNRLAFSDFKSFGLRRDGVTLVENAKVTWHGGKDWNDYRVKALNKHLTKHPSWHRVSPDHFYKDDIVMVSVEFEKNIDLGQMMKEKYYDKYEASLPQNERIESAFPPAIEETEAESNQRWESKRALKNKRISNFNFPNILYFDRPILL